LGSDHINIAILLQNYGAGIIPAPFFNGQYIKNRVNKIAQYFYHQPYYKKQLFLASKK
jgi:hypothetical protein